MDKRQTGSVKQAEGNPPAVSNSDYLAQLAGEREQMIDQAKAQATQNVYKALLVGGITGLGAGGAAYLLKRLFADDPETEGDDPILTIQQTKTAESAADAERPSGHWQQRYGVPVGGIASAVVGYALASVLADSLEARRLKREKEKAKAEFDSVIQQTLSGSGSKYSPLVIKSGAQLCLMSDVDAFSALLDYSARQLYGEVSEEEGVFNKMAGVTKEAVIDGSGNALDAVSGAARHIVNNIGTYLLGALGLSTGIGGYLGYQWSKRNNPNRLLLADLKKQKVYEDIYRPRSPIVKIAPALPMQPSEKKDEDENEDEDKPTMTWQDILSGSIGR